MPPHAGLSGIAFALDELVQTNGDNALVGALNLAIGRLEAGATAFFGRIPQKSVSGLKNGFAI